MAKFTFDTYIIYIKYYSFSSLSTTLIIFFFHIILEEIIATGSIKSMRKPTIPKRDEPVVIRVMSERTVIIISTGTTPITPFLTTFLPELVLENRPRVSEPNRAGIK